MNIRCPLTFSGRAFTERRSMFDEPIFIFVHDRWRMIFISSTGVGQWLLCGRFWTGGVFFWRRRLACPRACSHFCDRTLPPLVDSLVVTRILRITGHEVQFNSNQFTTDTTLQQHEQWIFDRCEKRSWFSCQDLTTIHHVDPMSFEAEVDYLMQNQIFEASEWHAIWHRINIGKCRWTCPICLHEYFADTFRRFFMIFNLDSYNWLEFLNCSWPSVERLYRRRF